MAVSLHAPCAEYWLGLVSRLSLLTKPNQCSNQLNGFGTICGQNLSLAQFIETPALTIYHYTVKGR